MEKINLERFSSAVTTAVSAHNEESTTLTDTEPSFMRVTRMVLLSFTSAER